MPQASPIDKLPAVKHDDATSRTHIQLAYELLAEQYGQLSSSDRRGRTGSSRLLMTRSQTTPTGRRQCVDTCTETGDI